MTVNRSIVAALVVLSVVAGCARKKAAPETPPPPPVDTPRPTPPGGAPPGFVLPAEDGKGGYRTPNVDLNEAEAVWHLRSALNVAALSCDRTGKGGIVAGYNKLLGAQKAALAKGYAAEGAHFGKGAALDSHVTGIYNYFAQPPAQPGFCLVAADVLKEVATVPAAGFAAYAGAALARLDAPFIGFYRAFAAYKIELAAWDAGDRSRKAAPEKTMMAAARVTAPVVPSAPWRIQLGAYSGDKAARDAWGKISARMSKAADFEPRYEPAPGGKLVRVQIGPITDRAEAIGLCAAASAAALDCFPVAPRS